MSKQLEEKPANSSVEKKKLRLLRYRTDQKELARFIKSYGRLRNMAEALSDTDPESVAAKREVEAEKLRLCRKTKRLLSQTREIDSAIDNLSDGTHALVLRYRYIDGLNWEEITEELCYSPRSVHYIHNQAVKELIL